ncbi:MAG: 4-hydroxy-tetrahydrodipicolinate synthase [Candidatus Jidaibacter sp.]|jgi:4-hydroxy-tetrahydrodipicolinate synthase|nr:4-hydroxy-tetrahydrodipicolinate synthase [Candidatus Jidaibacter sp.]
MFKGLLTALVTPFKKGEIDFESFANLISWQISEGIHGLVVNGTTGESPTIEENEFCELIKTAVKIADGRVPIVVGTGTNSTAKTIRLTQLAQKLCADAALVVAPYYNRPTQEGLHAHYKSVHDETNLPIILYNVPKRTGVDITADTVCKLAEHKRIVGVKECSGDISRVSYMDSMITKLGRKDFSILAGNDPESLTFAANGGKGCISVTANIAPKLLAYMHELMMAGQFKNALVLHNKMNILHNAMFCEVNPVPVKYALYMMGKIANELRSPLLPLSKEREKEVSSAMKEVGIL